MTNREPPLQVLYSRTPLEEPRLYLNTARRGGDEYGGDLDINSENDAGYKTFLLHNGKSTPILNSIERVELSNSGGESPTLRSTRTPPAVGLSTRKLRSSECTDQLHHIKTDGSVKESEAFAAYLSAQNLANSHDGCQSGSF